MIKKRITEETTLVGEVARIGEIFIDQIERMENNREPLGDGTTPLIYTPKINGVNRAADIRTDRFEVARELATVAQKSRTARRENSVKTEEKLDDTKSV